MILLKNCSQPQKYPRSDFKYKFPFKILLSPLPLFISCHIIPFSVTQLPPNDTQVPSERVRREKVIAVKRTPLRHLSRSMPKKPDNGTLPVIRHWIDWFD